MSYKRIKSRLDSINLNKGKVIGQLYVVKHLQEIYNNTLVTKLMSRL